jgi:hypothetical protein
MSETNPQAEGAPPPEPAVTRPEATAPAESGAVTEATEDAEPDKPTPEKARREERRLAAMSARLADKEAERQRLEQEVEHYRRQFSPQPAELQLTPEQQAAVDRAVEAKLAQRQAAERADNFHAAGRDAYPDWSDRCRNLMDMGADAQFADLLLQTPGGAKVAGALADDPEAVQRIAGLKGVAARAIALGQYAAALESKLAAATRTSRAPAPIRPINGASARVEFDEHTATPAQLVEFYSKQAMQKRGL